MHKDEKRKEKTNITENCHDLGVSLPTGYEMVNVFIDHLHTPLGTTNNYITIADFHTLQIASTR
jgi:hypothetical protein